jgi:formyl-CoA transferase
MARVKNAHAFAFVCKDNLPLAIHCSVPEKFWLALLRAVERTDLATEEKFKSRVARRENYEALEQALAPIFRLRTRDEWLRRLEANDVPAAPLYTVAEAVADPQVSDLELIEEVEHPVAGKMRFVGAPVRYDNQPRHPSLPPPLVGEHSTAILRELGRSDAVIRRLQEQKIIGTRE